MELNTLITTDRPKLDINDQYLPDGNYSFVIQHFSDGGNVTGMVEGTVTEKYDSLNKPIKKHIKKKYTFKYYSVIQMMAKAQSQVARRAKTISSKRIEDLDFNNIPSYPSPRNLHGTMRNIVLDSSESSDDGSPKLIYRKSELNNNCNYNDRFLPILGPPTDIIEEKEKKKKKKKRNHFFRKKKSIDEAECMICLNSENLNKTLKCGHKFHYHCIFRWYSNYEHSSPICRSTITELAEHI